MVGGAYHRRGKTIAVPLRCSFSHQMLDAVAKSLSRELAVSGATRPGSAARLLHAFSGQPLSLGGKLLDVLALWLTALAALVSMLHPGAAVATPALARVKLFHHSTPSAATTGTSNNH